MVNASTLPYGRMELRQVWYRNLVLGVLFSAFAHLCVIAAYYTIRILSQDDENIPTVSVRVVKYSDLGPPPSIAAAPTPPPVGVATAAKPSVGTPVPVPDAEVSPEQTIATQQELSSAPSPAVDDLAGGGDIQIAQDIVIEDEPGMNEFIPVEKEPQIVKRVIPEYPDLALRAGIEGRVWVKILVGKDGIPQKAVVVKSTTEIFNDVAIKAAMQFVFTPAVMNNGPVRVWVSFPFTFTLKDARTS